MGEAKFQTTMSDSSLLITPRERPSNGAVAEICEWLLSANSVEKVAASSCQQQDPTLGERGAGSMLGQLPGVQAEWEKSNIKPNKEQCN